MQEIKIVLVGDGKIYTEKVGKTSMIKALINDSAFDEIQDTHVPVKVPAELCQTDCSATIIDTWYRQDLDCLESIKTELSKADVVILVYDITKPDTIDRLGSFWCEFITKTCKAPIVIVGNKVDQKPNVENESIEDIMRPLIAEYKQCELILECSATSFINLQEVYTFAQKVVLYPTSPLYNTISKDLTEEFKRALVLIFLKCDRGKRLALTNNDMISMHAEVFSSQLTDEDLERIKEVIKQEHPQGVNEVGIRLEGFYQLQKMMIRRQKINVCWNLLKHFGFDSNLNLLVEFVLNKNHDESIELTRAAITHLEYIFNQYCVKGLLHFDSLFEIFKAAACPPWDPKNLDRSAWRKIYEMVECHEDCFSMQSWLALWHLLTLQDYHNALVYLVYTGCDIPYAELFLITSQREVMETNYRRVFCGFVLCDEETESAWVSQEFLGSSEPFNLSEHPRWCCKVVEESNVLWECKYQVLVNFPSGYSGFSRIVGLCDVVLTVSDTEKVKSEEMIPATVPRIRLAESMLQVQIAKSLQKIFLYSCKPFEGLDDRIKEQMLRNRREKRTYIVQIASLLGLVLAAGLIFMKKR